VRRIEVRPPECGGDHFTVLRFNLNRVGQEQPEGEDLELELEVAAFDYSPAVFAALVREAGLELILQDREGSRHILTVRRR